MVCDDSATMRSLVRTTLGSAEGIVVTEQAANGAEAVARFQEDPFCADVLVTDIEMPVMDGLTALPLLLKAAPHLRVIVNSAFTPRGGITTLSALCLGAVDCVLKPTAHDPDSMVAFRQELLDKVQGLGRPPPATVPNQPSYVLRPARRLRPTLLAIGSSTGGPQTLVTILQTLKRHLPGGLGVPIVLTQHMPAALMAPLADRLTRLGGIPCIEAQDGATLRPDRVHLAPGGRHLKICRGPLGLLTRLADSPPENHCRPAIDVMLRSAVTATHGRVLLMMLTGMGQDGLAGTRALVAAGGTAYAQDEPSSIVWGMPGAIARAGLCEAVLPPEALARQAARRLDPA